MVVDKGLRGNGIDWELRADPLDEVINLLLESLCGLHGSLPCVGLRSLALILGFEFLGNRGVPLALDLPCRKLLGELLWILDPLVCECREASCQNPSGPKVGGSNTLTVELRPDFRIVLIDRLQLG